MAVSESQMQSWLLRFRVRELLKASKKLLTRKEWEVYLLENFATVPIDVVTEESKFDFWEELVDQCLIKSH